jgi:hypothetical protein
MLAFWADPDHRSGYFVGGRKLFQRHSLAESHPCHRGADGHHRRHDHGGSRHHGNDDAAIVLRESLVRG